MYKHLTSQQRYTIHTLLDKGESRKQIAMLIGVDTSTITREYNRNSGKHRSYNWETAQKNAELKKKTQTRESCKIKRNKRRGYTPIRNRNNGLQNRSVLF